MITGSLLLIFGKGMIPQCTISKLYKFFEDEVAQF